jgi:hypothetical protein
MVAGGSDNAPKLEHRGYNRGLILGLTMAESMLLLVFCLLLVAAAMISAERNKRYEVERKLEKAEQQVAVLEKKRAEQAAEIVLLQSKVVSGDLTAADKAVVDKQWRELVLAKEALDSVTDQGATPADLQSLSKIAAVLREHGI